MQISYFEEFPTKDNLSKLKLIKGKTNLYLAAKSLKEFKKLSKNLRAECIYWPLLEKKEGYWISPWSKRSALKRIFSELEREKIPVMLDLELPTTKNPWLYLTQKINFFRNKILIKNFIESYPGQTYLAEYYPEGTWKEKIMQWCGLHYSNSKVKVIKMVYHSLHHFEENFIVKEIARGKEEWGENYLVALGTIAKGVKGNEPLLSPEQLEKDLQLCQRCGIKEVIIFRLGGLNQEYWRIIKRSS
jgi:hypothetical protein